jgi:hypothetical protein
MYSGVKWGLSFTFTLNDYLNVNSQRLGWKFISSEILSIDTINQPYLDIYMGDTSGKKVIVSLNIMNMYAVNKCIKGCYLYEFTDIPQTASK